MTYRRERAQTLISRLSNRLISIHRHYVYGTLGRPITRAPRVIRKRKIIRSMILKAAPMTLEYRYSARPYTSVLRKYLSTGFHLSLKSSAAQNQNIGYSSLLFAAISESELRTSAPVLSNHINVPARNLLS
jgi:hypothetical protein